MCGDENEYLYHNIHCGEPQHCAEDKAVQVFVFDFRNRHTFLYIYVIAGYMIDMTVSPSLSAGYFT